VTTALALGGSDCEAWHPGLLHQPVNALSSLAYVLAGAWLATRPGDGAADRMRGVVYGAAVAGTGLGSLLYHGPQWAGSAFVHDAAVPAALLFIAVDDVALVRGWTRRREMAGYAAGLGAASLLVAVVPASSGTAAAASGALAVTAEVVVARRGWRAPGRTVLTVAGTVVAAGVAALAGRTGSPWCRPHSLVQGHAWWHLLTVAALLEWDVLRRTRALIRPGTG
jgi:hypothetical protein